MASEPESESEKRASFQSKRSIFRISPTNEAANCSTVDECKAKIDAELERDYPREWVIGLFNQRINELRE